MLNTEEIKSRTAAIVQRSKDDAQEIHILAVSCIGHAMVYGDVTLGTHLVNALPKSVDRKALVTYFAKNGPFTWRSNDASFKLNKKFRDEKVFDETKLSEGVRWYDYAPETRQIEITFNPLKRAASLLSQLANAKKVEEREFGDYLADAIKKYGLDKAAALRAIHEKSDAERGVTGGTTLPESFNGTAQEAPQVQVQAQAA